MPLIPPETIEQIQSANDIVEVVGAYFPLKRAGPVFKALCPFHQERTPSFSVNPQRQIFKCFGCGAGGSVIRFVMLYENLDFIAAARKLAERARIPLDLDELSPEYSAQIELRRRLISLHALATDFFHRQLLRSPAAQPARDYLRSRGVSVEVAKRWKLGYAPGGGNTMAALARSEGFSHTELLEAGLVKPRFDDRPDGPTYDRFRERVMFPINKDTGETIAFSGRVLDPEAKTAKYLNSPETPLFTKGAVLFGLDRSKRALIQAKSAIVCEGQLDLITAFEAGIENVIAPQGTAFTEKQAHILKRYVDEVVLCFDSDAAGEKASERSLPSLLAQNLSVRVAQMPAGHDPDSLIRSEGAAAFSAQISGAKDFFEFQLDRLTLQPGFATPKGRTSAAHKVAAFLSLLSDPIRRETELQRASHRLSLPPQEFARLIKPVRTSSPAQPAESTPASSVEDTAPALQDPTVRLLATVALLDDNARAWLREENWEDLLARETEGPLLAKILGSDLVPGDLASVNRFLASLDPREESAVSGILSATPPKLPLLIAQDCWRALEKRQIRDRMTALEIQIRNRTLPEEDVLQLQKQILALKNRLSDIVGLLKPPL